MLNNLSSRKTYMDDNKIDYSDTNNIKMKHCNTKTEIYNRKQNKGVKIGHLNIRSLLKKIDEIKILIHQNSFDILAISETWLSDKIPNELVNIPGLNVYRKDRPSHGGGVLIYIKETLPYLILDENLCENQAHFIETLLCCKQLIVEPTRVKQSSQSVIDHIYTTMPHNHLDHGILKYTLSDHYFIFPTLGAKLLLQNLFTKKITMK